MQYINMFVDNSSVFIPNVQYRSNECCCVEQALKKIEKDKGEKSQTRSQKIPLTLLFYFNFPLGRSQIRITWSIFESIKGLLNHIQQSGVFATSKILVIPYRLLVYNWLRLFKIPAYDQLSHQPRELLWSHSRASDLVVARSWLLHNIICRNMMISKLISHSPSL